jgi:hypothetical protein
LIEGAPHKVGAIAVGLLANSVVVAQPSRAVTQPSPAISFGEQLYFFERQ